MWLQVAEKDRALQVTKGDLIDTKLELQRSETRLEVRLSWLLVLHLVPRALCYARCATHRSAGKLRNLVALDKTAARVTAVRQGAALGSPSRLNARC